MKVKLYMQNYDSQKEGNFCKTNRTEKVETFFFLQSQGEVNAFCFCCVYLSNSGNYLNLFLGSNTFVSRDVHLICHSASDGENPLNILHVLCAAHF